jgi:excisionase family DNA binding protein
MSQRIVEHVTKTDAHESQLMTPEQCAAFLQIEVNTLYVMKSQRRIPYRKVGHLLRFDFKEIVEWTKPKQD